MPFPKPRIDEPLVQGLPQSASQPITDDDSKDGTKASGFVTASDNQPPRECGNCRKFANGACQDQTVTADQELGQKYGKQRTPEGLWSVDEDDCCDYFQSGQANTDNTESGTPAIGVAKEQ